MSESFTSVKIDAPNLHKVSRLPSMGDRADTLRGRHLLDNWYFTGILQFRCRVHLDGTREVKQGLS
jgi:hypothetical protein